MIDYRNIWKSLNLESQKTKSASEIVRKIPTYGAFSVFLATDFNNDLRLLYCKLDQHELLSISDFPKFKGLEISIIKSSIGEFEQAYFLKFKQTIPNTDIVFESLISDICQNIVSLQMENSLRDILIKILAEWKLFFEMDQDSILSLSSQKGLYGELIFLKDHLLNNFDFITALSFWTAADLTNHDFQINKIAVEVKTTSSKRHNKITISSEKQLDFTGLSKLYLFVLKINVHYNMATNRLPDLISSIYCVLIDDPVATYNFSLKLTKIGYNEKHFDKYTESFSILESSLYEVLDGFPRLINFNLPEGIGDLKYSIVLAACQQFKINIKTLEFI